MRAGLLRLLVSVCLASAAIVARAQVEAPDYERCGGLYRDVDTAVETAGVGDAQSAKVCGFPYLRVSRFLASFGPEELSEVGFDAWVDAMQDLDASARRIELANLPAAERARLREGAAEPLEAALAKCARTLRQRDLTGSGARQRLATAAQVPEDYRLWQRFLGLYPFTAIAFSRGIRKYQAEMSATYAKPLAELPESGALTHFAPPDELPALDVGALLQRARDNPLRVPQPNADDLASLFERFAPVFAIDVANDDDRLGRIRWGEAGAALVDTGAPTVYRLASHTRIGGQSLLQLNYVVWFPRRPKQSKMDLLGGELDSIIWRVTLDADGAPLAYDTVHSCGCYHMVYPTARLTAKPPPPTLAERLFVPQSAPTLAPGERIVLRVAARTHYVERVTTAAAGSFTDAVWYRNADYDELRSLAAANGVRRSLFAPDGLVHGSERGERALFWPMGIASAGAMRQWGRHATAFVGTRHFDDVDLFEKTFDLAR